MGVQVPICKDRPRPVVGTRPRRLAGADPCPARNS